MPLWYADYFELKTVKAQKTQEELCLLLNCLKNLDRGPVPGRALSLEIITKSIRLGVAGWWGTLLGLFFQSPLCVSLSLYSMANICSPNVNENRAYAINLTNLGGYMAVTESKNTGWSDHKFLTVHIIADHISGL